MKVPDHESVQLEIPNPHVLDSAEQFYAGAQALYAMPPGSGVLLPMLSNAAFAMELYIKSMASWSVIKDYQDYGNGVSGGIVTAQAQQRGHKLSALLDDVLPQVKANIDSLFSASKFSHDFAGLRECVQEYDNFFEDVRYNYENSCLEDLSLSNLRGTLELLRLVVKSIDHRHYVYK